MPDIEVSLSNIDDISNDITRYFLKNTNDEILYKIASEYEVSNVNDFKNFLEDKISDYCNLKEYIFSLVNENIKYFEKINIDGFLKFRLWKYTDYLRRISKEIYIEYLSFKKYEKMISLMKVIIKNADPIVFHLHIEVNNKNFFEIYDDFYNDITGICVNEFVEEYKDYNYTASDFLISTVLNLTPKVITLYNSDRIKNKDFLNTLKKLYENNLIIS